MKKRTVKIWLLTLALAMLMAMQVCAATKNGVVKESGVTHIYTNGKLIKNKLGYQVGSKYYRIDKTGAAVRVSKVKGLAGICLEENGKTLKKAFTFCSHLTYKENVKEPSSGANALSYYARYGFSKKKGNARVMAAMFYQMAIVLGYQNVEYVSGQIEDYDGEMIDHAWVTIQTSDRLYVYDPYFAHVWHVQTQRSAAGSGFQMGYSKGSDSVLQQYRYYSAEGTLLR